MKILVFCFLLLARLCAQDLSALEASAREELAKINIPGASIAVVRGDRVIYSAAVGKANVETNEPVRTEMLFRLGSTTKMMTAAALTGLAVEGKLDLNAPIEKYLPGLPGRISQVTASQLLSHTAGLRDEAPMFGSHDDSALGSGIRAWTDDWLFTSPGKIFSYSNPGYWLSGFLVETLTGKPYADAMDARVFKPLGMTRTTLRPLLAITWPLATGHEEAPGNQCRVIRPAANNAATWPAGSVFSNTEDLAKFVIAFMSGGKPGLDARTIALMSKPHAPYPDSKNAYGYGLTVRDAGGVRIAEHGGSRSGYGSFIRMAPEQRVAVIVQTNRTGGNLPATVNKAFELLLPETKQPPPAAPADLPIAAEDIKRLEGEYRNGAQRVVASVKDGKLFLKRGDGPELPVLKRSAVRYAAERGGEFVAVAGSDGRVEYLHAGSRALARVR
jgi:CubicO group peptidase (beta-lactamase class C family)